MIGQIFGDLTVITRRNQRKNGYIQWVCRCDCGGWRTARSSQLKSGAVWNCGCRQRPSKGATTHGASKTRLYGIWLSMRGRCRFDVNYYSRGITVAQEWEHFETFKEWADSAGYDPDRRDLSIDRIDNGGDYEPGNCRWADKSTQNRNRRNNRVITISEETMTAIEWSERTGVKYTTIIRRIESGKVGLALIRKPWGR